MSLLEQNTIKKWQADKNITEFKTGSNKKEYEVEKI